MVAPTWPRLILKTTQQDQARLIFQREPTGNKPEQSPWLKIRSLFQKKQLSSHFPVTTVTFSPFRINFWLTAFSQALQKQKWQRWEGRETLKPLYIELPLGVWVRNGTEVLLLLLLPFLEGRKQTLDFHPQYNFIMRIDAAPPHFNPKLSVRKLSGYKLQQFQKRLLKSGKNTVKHVTWERMWKTNVGGRECWEGWMWSEKKSMCLERSV